MAAITKLSEERKAHGISLFLVEDGMPGFQKGGILQKIGQNASVSMSNFEEHLFSEKWRIT